VDFGLSRVVDPLTLWANLSTNPHPKDARVAISRAKAQEMYPAITWLSWLDGTFKESSSPPAEGSGNFIIEFNNKQWFGIPHRSSANGTKYDGGRAQVLDWIDNHETPRVDGQEISAGLMFRTSSSNMTPSVANNGGSGVLQPLDLEVITAAHFYALGTKAHIGFNNIEVLGYEPVIQ
jgi:hypothetical protein